MSSRTTPHVALRSLSALCLLAVAACGSGGASGGSGGAVATGGSGTSTGGTTSSGGSTGSGGKNGSGGVTASGGATSSGGATASGGSKGTGGVSSSGGSTGSGGATATGGASATGGVSPSGGATGSGGATATGGQSATGGSAATGGQSATGGASGGGSTGSGGATSGGGTSGGSCIICDDFESSTSGLDAAKWVIDTSQGAAAGKAEIVSGGAHGSGKAVKVSGGYIKVAAATGTFSAVPSHFFLRVSMKFDMAQPSGHVTYMMLDDKTKMGQLRIGAQNGGMLWNYDTTDSILPDYNALTMSLKPPANEWHCFEFEIDGNAPALHAWMDGTESMQMLLDGTATTGIDDRWMRDMAGWKPAITNFSFGEGYPTGSLTTWFDDIAISASRIGCPL